MNLAPVYALALIVLIPGTNRDRILKASDRAETAQRKDETPKFIGAFELTQQSGFSFTWPFETMRPSSYKMVLLVVTRMPHGRSADGVSRPLVPARDLRINGRAQKPTRVTDRQTDFLVLLDKGRVHLTLAIPPGMRIDPQSDVARIKLFEPVAMNSKTRSGNSRSGRSDVDRPTKQR